MYVCIYVCVYVNVPSTTSKNGSHDTKKHREIKSFHIIIKITQQEQRIIEESQEIGKCLINTLKMALN